MSRTKIEEKLKVAEKEYSSVKFLSDSKSFMKMKIAQAKIQLLTSLLAEDGGEVVMSFNQLQDAILNTKATSEYKQASIVILRNIFEASQPAPSAEENPQPTDEERKHFAEHNNSRIIKYAEAPSAEVSANYMQFRKEFEL